MLVVVLLLAAVVAFGVACVAWRGRRHGDMSVCRQCEYDLRGLPTRTTNCPECGADLATPGTIVTGKRRRRPIVAAVLLLVALGLLTATVGYGSGRINSVSFLPYAPTSWVISEAKRPAGHAAIQELIARAATGKLGGSHGPAAVAAALASQRARGPWNNDWGHLLETLRVAGQLSDADWRTYVRQASRFGVHAADVQTVGDLANVGVDVSNVGHGDAIVTGRWKVRGITLNGTAIEDLDEHGTFVVSPHNSRTSRSSRMILHDLQSVGRVKVVARLDIAYSAAPNAKSKADHWRETIYLRTEFDVVPRPPESERRRKRRSIYGIEVPMPWSSGTILPGLGGHNPPARP